MDGQVDAKTVAGYFDSLGWSHKVIDERTVTSAIRCNVAYYYYAVPIEVVIGSHWITVRAYVQRSVAPERMQTVRSFISAANAFSRFARFAMLDDYVIAQADVANVQCHLGSFVDTLKAVDKLVTSRGLEVSVLATNASVAELYQAAETARWRRNRSTRSAGDELVADFDLVVNRLAD